MTFLGLAPSGGRVQPVPVSVAFGPAVFLIKSLVQMLTALCKGCYWVESIIRTHSYLQPELLHSLKPVAEIGALLLMSWEKFSFHFVGTQLCFCYFGQKMPLCNVTFWSVWSTANSWKTGLGN
jgi:hypothetical protein